MRVAAAWRLLALVLLAFGVVTLSVPAATTNALYNMRTHLMTRPELISSAKTTVVTNRVPGKVQLFITNAHAKDFSVLVRDNGGYQVATNALITRPGALEVSVPEGRPYILKSLQPVRAVLGTKPVFLGGAVGMNNLPTNGVSISLINDWRAYDPRSGAYTSQVQLCFIAPDTPDVRRFLPLTVQLYPTDGVAIRTHTIVINNLGYGACVETSIICQDRPDNKVTAKSDIGDAVLDIDFVPEPFIYRILPRPVFWNTLIFSLLGSLVRVVRSDYKKKTWWWTLLEMVVGLVAGLFLVGALWAGIGIGTLTEAAVGKLTGVAVVAIIAGYGGSTILEWASKKWLP